MRSIEVGELFEIHAERLGLQWVAGRRGGHRLVDAEGVQSTARVLVEDDMTQVESGRGEFIEISPNKSLVGHLNLIHPNRLQILGYSELQWLNGLREISRRDAVRQLIANEPDCVIVAEGQTASPLLSGACDESDTPLFVTDMSSDKLSDALHYYLTNLLAESVTLHGVFMEVTAIGVLLTGPSGVGKSELALELITRGHRLVADDAPQFSRLAPDIVNGTCPEALIDFLEVRGIGILNVRELFGDSAIKRNKYLRLIVRMEPFDKEALYDLDRLEGSYKSRRILDVDIPEITIPVAPGRNLAVLVECAARNHLLRMSGYNASEAFMERQRALIQRGMDG